MDIVAAMKVFISTVDAGSFAAAANRLGISRAMASKHIAALEEHLGTRLLNRTTRRLSLTESGAEFYERSVQIVADVEEAEQIAGHSAAEPRGVLKLTMPLSYGQHRMGALMAAYAAQHPQVRLDLSLTDRKVDLVEEGFDLAIRIGKLPESGLVARRLGTERSVIVASPHYLKRHGAPRSPAELAGHACLAYSLASTGDEWRLQGPGGIVSVRCPGTIKADSGDMLRQMAIAGSGIIFQPWFIVEDDVNAGRLVRLLPDFASEELGVYAIYPSRRHLSAKVRTFVDFLASRLCDASHEPP